MPAGWGLGHWRWLLPLLLLWTTSGQEATAQPTSGERPILRWGGDAEGGAPYLLPDPSDPQRITGFEVDLMAALGQRLGRDPVFVQNQWDGLIPGLLRGSYDLVVNGVEITDDRRQRIDFSIPYYACGEQLSVRAGESRIASLADLEGRLVGTLKFSEAQRILERVRGVDLRTYENQNNAYDDLAIGRLDAVLMDWPIAVYYSRPNPQLQFAGPSISEVRYGIGLRPADKDLRREVDAALQDLIRTGELERIYRKWEIWNDETDRLFRSMAFSAPPPSPSGQEMNGMVAEVNGQASSASKWRERGRQLLRYLRPMLLQGVPMTLALSLLGMALAMALGLCLALINLYGPRSLSWLARAYIELFRGTPLLIQLYLIYYGLPTLGIRFSPLWAAIIGLGMNYAAYEAENYRAGIIAIPREQFEAGLSLGMSRAQTLGHIVRPQAARLVIPPVTNDFIALLKDSSIVSVITMVELTKVYGQLAATYYDYIGAGLLAAALYYLLGLPFVRLSRWAERRLDPARQPTLVRARMEKERQ